MPVPMGYDMGCYEADKRGYYTMEGQVYVEFDCDSPYPYDPYFLVRYAKSVLPASVLLRFNTCSGIDFNTLYAELESRVGGWDQYEILISGLMEVYGSPQAEPPPSPSPEHP